MLSAESLKERDEAIATWWANWWREDWSWPGLARKPWIGWVIVARDDGEFAVEGDTGRIYGQADPAAQLPVEGRGATLQDYWRADPETGKLRDATRMIADGDIHSLESSRAGEATDLLARSSTFHSVHLAPRNKDGRATPKADWKDDALDLLIRGRLKAACATEMKPAYALHGPKTVDRRAQLQGTVLPRLAAIHAGSNSEICGNFDACAVLGQVVLEGCKLQAGTSFRGTLLAGAANFRNAKLNGEMRFDACVFGDSTTFDHACFDSGGWFVHTRFFGPASFQASTFENASFPMCRFHGPFTIGASIDGIFDIQDCHFRVGAKIANTRTGDMVIAWRVRFSGPVAFEGLNAAAQLWLDESSFEDTCNFSSVRIGEFLSVAKCRFHGRVSLVDVSIVQLFTMDDARFDDRVVFADCTFLGGVSTEQTSFAVELQWAE